MIEDHLRREGITLDDLEMALREHGIDEIKNTRLAILEVDGTISVVPEEAPVYRSRRRVRGRKPGG